MQAELWQIIVIKPARPCFTRLKNLFALYLFRSSIKHFSRFPAEHIKDSGKAVAEVVSTETWVTLCTGSWPLGCKKVRPAGLEPAAYGLEIRCSIQLSYGRFNLNSL